MIEAGFYVLSGSMLYAGAHHLYVGASRRIAQPHLPLAAMYLLLAGFVLTSTLSYSSQQIGTRIQLAGFAMTLDILLWIALIWYVAFSTGTKALLLLDLLTAAWLICLIANIISPDALPSGGTASAVHPSAESWLIAVKFTMLTSLLFCFFAAARNFQLGNRARALVLLCGLSILLISSLTDYLLNTPVRHTLSFVPFGFMGFLLADSLYHIHLVYRRKLAALPAPSTYRLTFDSGLTSFRSTLSALQPVLPQGDGITAAPPRQIAAVEDRTRSPAGPVVRPDSDIVVRHRRQQSLSLKQAGATKTAIGKLGSTDDAGENARQRDKPDSTATHNQSALNTVSDNLIDIAVWATMALNRFKRGDADVQALETLCRKIRSKALKTRRMANKLSCPDKSA